MPGPPVILFTAFEPSGDALAAGLIRALRRERPEVVIHALGGPRMAEAGAELLESTTDKAVMLASAARQALVHRARLKRLDAFLRTTPITALVPTDSPAANWSVCKLVRKRAPQARIVHLAAPQLWAWAEWRIRKLRRLTDHVLCLLPFEPTWFDARGVPGTFVGHPLVDAHGAHTAEPQRDGDGPPRLALLPGSRHSEVAANAAEMLAAARQLQDRLPELVVEIATADAAGERQVRAMLEAGPRWPREPAVRTGEVDDVLAHAHAALVVSGTATLHAAVYRAPMVVLYRIGYLAWHVIGRWVVSTRTFSLPNLIAASQGHGRIVPEHVPHFGDVELLLRDLEPLLRDPARRQAQRAALDEALAPFDEVRFEETAPRVLLEVIERRR